MFNIENSYCSLISQKYKCDKIKSFCLDEGKFFWCPNGKYLDINELTCNDDCPQGFTRPPDIIDGEGMCYINTTEKHYSEYPRLNSDLKQGIYEYKFKCDEDYTLVNYNCIQNDKIDITSFYFGSKYKFSNLISYYNNLSVPIVNYFIDFWFIFDLTDKNKFDANDDTKYTLFIAFPHILIRYKNKIQYNNGYIPLDYYDIIDIKDIKYIWNHVVIENYQTYGITSADSYKYINIYWNNDYFNPKLTLKITNDNKYDLAQIAFCHKSNEKFSICLLGLNYKKSKIMYPIWFGMEITLLFHL